MRKSVIAFTVLGGLLVFTAVVVIYICMKLRQLRRWRRTQQAVRYFESLPLPPKDAFGTIKYAILRRLIVTDNNIQKQRTQEKNPEIANQDRSCCICLEQYVDESGKPIIPEAMPEHEHCPSDQNVVNCDGRNLGDVTDPIVTGNNTISNVNMNVSHQIGGMHFNILPHDASTYSNFLHHGAVYSGYPHQNAVDHSVAFNNVQSLQQHSTTIYNCSNHCEQNNAPQHNGNVDQNGNLVLGLLKCGHAFHFECIWKWMQSRTKCPVCRTYTDMNQNDIHAVSLFVAFPDLEGKSDNTGSGPKDRKDEENTEIQMRDKLDCTVGKSKSGTKQMCVFSVEKELERKDKSSEVTATDQQTNKRLPRTRLESNSKVRNKFAGTD